MSGGSREIQGFSKVEDPGQGLVRVRGEASELASDVRDLMPIHQREHHGVEHSQHLSHQREADTTTILPQGHIATPVETIFHGPMRANQLRKTLWGTALLRKTRPAIDHLHAVLVSASVLSLSTTDLSPTAPHPGQ